MAGQVDQTIRDMAGQVDQTIQDKAGQDDQTIQDKAGQDDQTIQDKAGQDDQTIRDKAGQADRTRQDKASETKTSPHLKHLLAQDGEGLEVAAVVGAETQLVEDARPQAQLKGVRVGQNLVAHFVRHAVVARVVLIQGHHRKQINQHVTNNDS